MTDTISSSKYSKLLYQTARMSKDQTTAIWDYVDELRAIIRERDTDLADRTKLQNRLMELSNDTEGKQNAD